MFSLLKKEIAQAMMKSYPGIDPDVSSWKGQQILEFQEDLLKKVNGQLSEKWFYTHMKASNGKLPRIDVLNLLSRYAGYIDWQDFRFKNGHIFRPDITVPGKSGKSLSILVRIPLLFMAVMALILIILKMINTQSYRFTFIDNDTGEPILNNVIHAELLMSDQSPVNFTSDEKGDIIVRTNKGRINMIVKAPYYISDTIKRGLRKFSTDVKIGLKPDYYALMISYFSQSDVSSWERRREQLEAIISDDAIIYQFPDKNAGSSMALYNKQEFIDKITIPSSGLRDIEILDCHYIDGKIAVLRFRIMRDME
ncbi:MAG: hypothetical protein JXR66_05410 [Bacteroidales bacterium]|nr:hypothetical protein [Bacteroidales bacterium]